MKSSKKNIVGQLCWDNRVDTSKISVEVRDVKVKLQGYVSNYPGGRAAISDVWNISGVTPPKTI